MGQCYLIILDINLYFLFFGKTENLLNQQDLDFFGLFQRFVQDAVLISFR